MIISALLSSCKKDNDSPVKPAVDDPKATSCACRTFNISGSFTGAAYTFTPTIPDTNAVVKVILRVAKNLYPVFDFEKPKSRNNTFALYFEKCPFKSDNAIYFFEWIMKDGRVIKGESFQIWE